MKNFTEPKKQPILKKKKNTTKSIFDLRHEFDTREQFIDYIHNLSLEWIKTNKKVEYANVSATIDIESSSFLDTNGNKTAIMYCFTFGINGHSYLGRTYDDLLFMTQLLVDTFELNFYRRIIIYIHNLAYEFQFFYKHFTWERIFAVKERTPLTALTTGGIELRCSFLLSGYSLAKTGEHLQKYKVEKKVGDLDYSLIRHSQTPLTDKEKGYVLNDGEVVMAYIQEMIESHGNKITRLPMTKTGETRKYCRDMCLYGGGGSHKKTGFLYRKYRGRIRQLPMSSIGEYQQLKRAFAGGFTHANPLIVGQEVKNVDSFDFTSSYPYVMVANKFPMLKGEIIEIHTYDELIENCKLYCCLFDVKFINIRSKISYEHYISFSHCRKVENYRLDNGRIVDADTLTTTITEQDFFIIEKCYQWDKILIGKFRRYKRDYLPTPFVKSILELYKTKTELKGIDGKDAEYMYAKENVNSTYGMSVTDICRSEKKFDTSKNEWSNEHEEIDYEKQIEKYNNSPQRFLCYQWGIWVTAYARANLWSGIHEFKEHYLYSDTDSIKVIHTDEHMDYINRYNRMVIYKLEKAMNYHGLSMDYVSPKSIDGNVHTLGLWDKETPIPYRRFKTMGAKRYMVEKGNGEYSLTISGINKKVAIPYLLKKYKDIFKVFKEDMYIPRGQTGKNIHTYIDEPRDGAVVDYLGNLGEYHELSCVHLEESEYTLSLAHDFIDFLFSLHMLEFN